MTEARVVRDWHPDMPTEYRNLIVTGDARELAKRIPDESIDLIFTDPVYDRIDDYRWLAETAARALKPSGAMLAFLGIGYIKETLQALDSGGFSHRWICAVFVPGAGSRIAQHAFGNWQAMAWCGGEPLRHISDAVISNTATLSGNHRWRKNTVPLAKYIHWFTNAGGVIYDPFCGGGTISAVCKMLGRNYIASEIDPDTARLARERVERTQPPLAGFNEAMQQAAMFGDNGKVDAPD